MTFAHVSIKDYAKGRKYTVNVRVRIFFEMSVFVNGYLFSDIERIM